ncbi:spermatogenesis-associated protein 13 [Brienomyrus brachyistius]|uniref:spermatogenesis-associated protein 13 n=1 Tax=Brienomyrus brachyistius TaxID=42636 RepID=UPI0020B276EE|nr:spermatogenesis-associated protein 13 [Brienomyrus brachyistius]
MEKTLDVRDSLPRKTPPTCGISPSSDPLSAACLPSTFVKAQQPSQCKQATISAGNRSSEAEGERQVYENSNIGEFRLSGRNEESWVDSTSPSKVTCCAPSATHRQSSPKKLPLRGSAAWPALSGLRVMGSFRKLRSSVLQGIQSCGETAALSNSQGHTMSASQSQNNVVVLEGSEMETSVLNHRQKLRTSWQSEEACSCDDEEEEEHMLQRNTLWSHSLRMALSAGRMSPLNIGPESCGPESCGPESCGPGQQRGAQPGQPEKAKHQAMFHRLSRSTDSLHLFSHPFRNSSGAPEDGGLRNIHRATSSTSMELAAQGLAQWRAQTQKLLSSMTDLSRWKRAAPRSQATMRPLSVLHDAYSRRTPCIAGGERHRRQPHARGWPGPSSSGEAIKQDCLPPQDKNNVSKSLGAASDVPPAALPSAAPDTPPSAPPSTPPDMPPSVLPSTALDMVPSALPSMTPDMHLFSPDTPIDITIYSSDMIRHKTDWVRPRPLSDYGQLVTGKFSIPEKEVGSQSGEIISRPGLKDHSTSRRKYKNAEYCHQDTEVEPCGTHPVSVVEGVNLYSPSSAKLLLQPESHPQTSYRKALSHPRSTALSQSTPTGLDRLGRGPVLHRVHSAGAPAQGSVTLEEAVTEEHCSFQELPDSQLHLKSTVDHTQLSKCICSGLVVHAEALWDHVTMEEQCLAFKAGDVVRVVDVPDSDWWRGMMADQSGWFPSSFVRVRVNQDAGVGSMESMQAQENPLSNNMCDIWSLRSLELRGQMRANVVKEIMSTERIYLKHLKDICEGYVRQCRKHAAMFSPQQLVTIFSNIEDIYRFHRKFLKELEKKYNPVQPHLSEIGSCFLLQGEGFSIYSEYCNNHPRASSELHRLMSLSRYRHFFEACRLLQQMIDISLGGFLLTPVQKICKYPLQLRELLKYTSEEHRDYESVSDALKAMKKVACLINERKRRLESIDAIAQWQAAILHWEGDDILGRSSELIHSGELTRMILHGKSQQRTFFLFDHQLIFCKKDLLRRDLLHYRGRLDLDHMDLLDLANGHNAAHSTFLKHAFKLLDKITGESHVLCCRKPEDKQKWLEALARERHRVQEAEEMGIEISESQRKAAILNANAKKLKRGNMNNVGFAGCALVPPHQPLHPLHQRHVTVPTRLPQQRVISLAEPMHKPFHLWDSITKHARLRK